MQLISVKRVHSNKLHHNYKLSATTASLRYVTDSVPGIQRKRKGTGFSYYYQDSLVTDKEILLRIKKLVIPPAWTNVWICYHDSGHIQATGFDIKNRKQYRYHANWNELRNQTKFQHLYEFGKALPDLRRKVEQDISEHSLSKEKVLATVVSLMEKTFIRIGNCEYEKLYGSYGLTTLKDGHVKINGGTMQFSFKGKKGVFHSITLKNKRLARIVKACRDIPGKELFQYINEEGIRCSIDSGMINNYIKEGTGKDFSAKDFRTWAGSLSILNSFKSFAPIENQSDIKKNVLNALDEVSKKLGNTRTVCRKYYVHPQIVKLYEEEKLHKYFAALDDPSDQQQGADLTVDEKILMKILKSIDSY